MSLNTTMITISLLLILVSLLSIVQTFMSPAKKNNKNTLSSLESGFETLLMTNNLELQYFLLAALFVLFDVELMLLMPFILSYSSNIWTWITLMVITITLFLEWQWTSLKWSV